MSDTPRRMIVAAALTIAVMLGVAAAPAQASEESSPLVQTVQYYGPRPGFHGPPRGHYGRPFYGRPGYAGRPHFFGRHRGFYGRPHRGFYR